MKYSNLIARAAACAIFPVAALAQSATSVPALLDPTDAQAPVPPLRYESPLGGYQPAEEATSPAESWRARNELVGRTGGMSMMEGMVHGSMDETGAKTRKRADDGSPGMDMPAGDDSPHH